MVRKLIALGGVVLIAWLCAGCADEGTNLPLIEGDVRLECSIVPRDLDSASMTISQVYLVLNGSRIGMLPSAAAVGQQDAGDTATALLAQNALPIGEYAKAIVTFSAVALRQGGALLPVQLWSTATTGAEYLQRFTVQADTRRNLLLEVNLYRSLTAITVAKDGGDSLYYRFTPVIRFIDKDAGGHLRGRIGNPEHRPTVFFLSGKDTVTAVPVNAANGAFVGAFLPAQPLSVFARDTLGRVARLDSVVIDRGATRDVGTLVLHPL
jgi:hypothetical protein